MKLSKALKEKNTKISEYKKNLSKAINVNSYDVDSKKIFNANDLLELAKSQREYLVKLKTAIHKASEPIREKIFMLSELKSYLSTLNSLSTTEGLVKTDDYGRARTEAVQYAADIDLLTKEEMIKEIEKEIEIIQDEIDYFNATTDIVL